MKLSYLLTILLLYSLNASAKLQTKFFNCSFGDSKEQVANKMRINGYTPIKGNEGLHYIGLSFGGVNGWTVSFEYKNYRFYRIEFVKDDTSKYPILTDISRKIAAKYPQYVIEDFVDCYPNDFFRFDGGCKISDGQVTCYMYANRIRLPNNNGNICQISDMRNQEMEDSQVLMICKL